MLTGHAACMGGGGGGGGGGGAVSMHDMEGAAMSSEFKQLHNQLMGTYTTSSPFSHEQTSLTFSFISSFQGGSISQLPHISSSVFLLKGNEKLSWNSAVAHQTPQCCIHDTDRFITSCSM